MEDDKINIKVESDLIKLGDYVMVQRQEYYKLEKLERRTCIRFGNRNVDISTIINKPYFSTFRVVPNTNPEYSNAAQYILEETTDVKTVNQLSIDQSGLDNRSITDDGQSQVLTKEEIEKLRETSDSTVDLVETIINNSKTFTSKTKYCQDKYLKKKEKKYFDYVQVRRPTVRLMTDMSIRWGLKTNLGLRSEHLSYLLTVANVHSEGTYILHDGGTKGILTAAIMDRIGANTNGRLLYLHPGNQCQRMAFEAMDFPQEQTKRCLEVNLYSVLRCFYQYTNGTTIEKDTCEEKTDIEIIDKKEECEVVETNIATGIKRKAEAQEEDGETQQPQKKKHSWEIENEKVRKILHERRTDSLIIATRTFPDNLIDELLPFVKSGGMLVIYSHFNQVLTEIYYHLKKRVDVINIRISSTLKTNVQVIEDVTHPEVNKTYGGYILSANKISV